MSRHHLSGITSSLKSHGMQIHTEEPALAWNVWDKRMPINFNKPTVKPTVKPSAFQETNFFFALSEPNVRMFGQPSGVSIQFLSDTHLDHLLYQHVPIQPAAPIILLFGDIGRFDDYDQYRDFLIHHSARFEKLLLVAGNHEFYGSSRTQGLEAAERLIREPKMNSKLGCLNRGRSDVPYTGMTILGCTLHSHIASSDYNKLNRDFARIKEWRAADHNREHEKDLAWLKRSIAVCSQEQLRRKIVVATHYAPRFEKTTHPFNENNAISQCFSSHTLTAIKNWEGARHVKYWLFGHTHWNTRFKSGDTVVMSDCRSNDNSRLSWWQKQFRYRPFDEQATIVL